MSRRLTIPGVLLLALAAVASAGCLDLLGHDEDTTQAHTSQGLTQNEDDQIGDKHPTFDPSRTVTETIDSCQVTLNKSATVTKLDIVPFEGLEVGPLQGKLFRGRTEAIAAAETVGGADLLPSMEVVNGALKPFNDGLYAAVELSAEDDKHALLATIQGRLGDLLASAPAAARPALDDAAVLVGAALSLGGDTSPAPAGLDSRIAARVAVFQATPGLARPIGFYTWTPALQRIFTRDRLLQDDDDLEPFDTYVALAYVLGQDAALLAAYQHVTAIYAGLTDPYESDTVDLLIPYVPSLDAVASPAAARSALATAHPPAGGCGAPLVAFLPASHSKDKDFFDAQFCRSVPAGTNVLDAFIQAIQSGAVDLTPAADAGWYDYQLYALETLLLPERGDESQHLLLTAGYKKKLLETFKSLLIQTRETHIKQLGGAKAVSAVKEPVDVYPLLPAEPFPTFYLRTARGYRFLRTFLAATLGADFLPGHARLLETGDAAGKTLADELDARVSLLYGLSFLTTDAVGLPHEDGLLPDELAEIDAGAAVAAAKAWLDGPWRVDPDVARDPRVAVPMETSADEITTYSAVVGVKALEARAEFVAGHEPVVTPAFCWTNKLTSHRYTMLVEETVQFQLPSSHPPPTRDELRAVCDAHTTAADIVQALESQ